MNVVAYCRVSTNKSDQLNSLATQQAFFEEYTNQKGYHLMRIYSDEGISGTSIKKREQFKQMLQDAHKRQFEMVLVKDVSRFSRNTVDLLKSIRELKELGIKVIFLTAGLDSMPESEMVITVFAALAQEESANMSKRIKFGKHQNAQHGRVPNLVYGYDKLNGELFSLTVNEEEAGYIRQIFTWYVEDGYGSGKIAKMLNVQNVRTKRGCNWTTKAICRILTNELYVGRIANEKQEVKDFLTGKRAKKEKGQWLVTECPELRIVDEATFAQAQVIIKSRDEAFKTNRERYSNKYLFSTLIKCKECGWSFRRTERTFKNTYVRWTCSRHNGVGADSCPNAISVDEDELIGALEDYFAEALKTKKDITRRMIEEYKRQYLNEDKNALREKKLKTELAKLQRSRQKYMDMFDNDLLTMPELKEKIGGMMEEVQRIEEELGRLEHCVVRGEQFEAAVKETFSTIESIVSVRDMTNAQLKKIVDRIKVDKDGNVDIHLRVLQSLDIPKTVLIADDRTQGHQRAAAHVQQDAVASGQGAAGGEQGPAPYPRRPRHPAEI